MMCQLMLYRQQQKKELLILVSQVLVVYDLFYPSIKEYTVSTVSAPLSIVLDVGNFVCPKANASNAAVLINYDINNNVVNTYDEIAIAAKALNGTRQNIRRAIRSNTTAYGYRWKYLSDELKEEMNNG